MCQSRALPAIYTLAPLCFNLPSLAFSSTVLATMFSSSIKNTKSQMQRFSVHKRPQRIKNCVLRMARWILVSSLLDDVRANFTCIKVVKDKTGCHRLACSASWTWFLLRAESPALHFYSNPPRTIPCVIWVRNLSDTEIKRPGCSDVRKPGFFFLTGFFRTEHRDPSSSTLQRQGLAEYTREHISAPPPPLLVRNQKRLGLFLSQQRQLHQDVSPK